MSTIGVLGLYRPGTTAVHRLGAAPKLLLLAAFGTALVVLRGPDVAVAGLVLAVLAAAAGHLPLRRTLRALLPVLIGAALIAGYQMWQRGPAAAIEPAAELLALVLAGAVVTATTSSDRLVDVLVRAARPLRHVGLDPDHVALAVALMLRAIPALGDVAAETRDAARARGLERSIRAQTVPLAIRAVARARATGDALAARGLGDPAS